MAILILIIIRKYKNKENIILFDFDNKNIIIIIITTMIYFIIIFSSLYLLIKNNIFYLDKYLFYIILVGVAEELFYRGLVYRLILLLNKDWKYKIFISIIICSLIFCLAHLPLFNDTLIENLRAFVFPFLGGIIFNIVYIKSRNILVPIMVHNFFNTFYFTALEL